MICKIYLIVYDFTHTLTGILFMMLKHNMLHCFPGTSDSLWYLFSHNLDEHMSKWKEPHKKWGKDDLYV